jgi:hypothetical protein
MTATMKTAILPIRQTWRAPDSDLASSLEEVLVSIAVNRIPDEYAKRPGFLPVLVLIAKSAVHKTTTAKKLAS